MFLNLICSALGRMSESSRIQPTTSRAGQAEKGTEDETVATPPHGTCTEDFTVSITIYEAKKQIYPRTEEEWDSYDGILIPGSFSAAYEEVDWIRSLRNTIQDHIHIKGRKTLGICFGHQVYAHSFCGASDEKDGSERTDGGLAVPCPSGTQVGRRVCRLGKVGNSLLDPIYSEGVSLLYTHGDMVSSLPSCAVNLGGTDNVPIQAAAYFLSADDASLFCDHAHEETSDRKKLSSVPSPYAFTFQAHPEFVSDIGFDDVFPEILEFLSEKKLLTGKELDNARNDALDNLVQIKDDSVNTMITIGSILGWWHRA